MLDHDHLGDAEPFGKCSRDVGREPARFSAASRENWKDGNTPIRSLPACTMSVMRGSAAARSGLAKATARQASNERMKRMMDFLKGEETAA
jgi:hypothetical protein